MAKTAPVEIVLTGPSIASAAIDNINKLRAGETTPQITNGVVNNIAILLRMAKMQMDLDRMSGRTPSVPWLLTGNEEK